MTFVILLEKVAPVAVKTINTYLVEGDDSFAVDIRDDLICVTVNDDADPIRFTSEEAREVACCMIALADQLDEIDEV